MARCRCCCSKSEQKVTSAPAGRRRYDAHLRAADIPFLRRLINRDDPSVGSMSLIADGFVITVKHGHNGSILFELTETD